jgi:hypothetical protein
MTASVILGLLENHPFALSLSKGFPSSSIQEEKGEGFDKLSPNGVGLGAI